MRLLGTVATDDIRYVDPPADVSGVDGLSTVIGAVQQQFPGMPLRAVGAVEEHHDVLRFRWELGPAGSMALVEGSDTVLLAPDGRFTAVFGFPDRVPG